jgi:hypothetical protein
VLQINLGRVRPRVALLLTAGLSLAAVVPSALGAGTGQLPAAPALAQQGPLDTAADGDVATFFEDRIADFFSPTARLREAPSPDDHGQVYNLVYATAERRPGDEVATSGAGDSALYTGNYLAGESYRFALAAHRLGLLAGLRADYLAAHPQADAGSNVGHGTGSEGLAAIDAQIEQWRTQQQEAKRRVDVLTRQFHLLSNISQAWDYAFAPSVNRHSVDPRDPEGAAAGAQALAEDAPGIVTGAPGTVTRPGFVDYGGGIIHGEPGLLFRACSRDDDPKAFDFSRNGERAFGPLRWAEDGHDYYCLGGTSRDAYAGTTYGLSTALELVGPSDPVLARRVAGDLMALTGFASKYLWTTPRPHGTVVLVPVSPFGHDFDHVISPLFVYVPSARLNMAAVARYAANLVGTDDQRLRFEEVYRQELATQLPQLTGSMLVDAEDPHSSYYKFHLNHMTLFDLWRLDPDPVVRTATAQAMGAMQATTGDDENALYEGLAYAMTGDPARLSEAVRDQRAYLDYFRATEASHHWVTNSTSCGRTVTDPTSGQPYDLTCVPTDEVRVVTTAPDGSRHEVVKPGTSTSLRALTALPIGLRKSADFMWQKDPTQLDGGFNNPRYANPGYDVLTTYWLIRYFSEVVRPGLSPFPPSGAPSFE